jgi:3-methyl-2-oxobutanoate hydroxymethyltransferase
MGGFRVQGRTEEQAERVLEEARAVERAGAYAIVLEGIPADLAARITGELSIVTIGIGAGAHCDGQVLVCYDLLGLTPDLKPRFVKRYDEWYERGMQAARQYCAEVRQGDFPAEEHSFGSVPREQRGSAGRNGSASSAGYGPQS